MATPVYIPICFYYASPRSIQREILSSSQSYYSIKAALISLGDKYKALISVYEALLNRQASRSVAGTTSCPPYPFSSVQSCPTLCDPMNHSTPGLPVHHHLPEFTQTHVHRVGDAIQPSHPLSSPFPPAPNPYPLSPAIFLLAHG